MTDEYWVLERVRPKFEYDIKVTGMSGTRREKIAGRVFDVPVWKWERL